jgi:hypothetical protein
MIPINTPIILSVLLLATSILPGLAQDKAAPLEIRAAYHNPVRPVVDLYLPDQSGNLVRLNLVAEGLSRPQLTRPLEGSLVLYSQPQVDPENPGDAVAAVYKLPADLRKAIILVFPASEGAKRPYRLVVINDAPTSFRKGESRIINLTPVETAVLAGEHKLTIPPGKLRTVPAVTGRNEFNMAQTNFYYKEGESWVPITERQLQFLDTTRRIFLVYLTRGSVQPFVTTIVDTTPEVLIVPLPAE